MSAGAATTVTASCSFCLKPSTDVAKLVAGHGVYICNECVALCSEIIQAEARAEAQAQPSGPVPSTAQPSTAQPSTAQPSTAQPSTAQPSTAQPSTAQPSTPPRVAPWEQEMSLDVVLAALPRVAAAGRQAEDYLAHWVRKARSLGATWARIGAALDMTRQSAWERFSCEE